MKFPERTHNFYTAVRDPLVENVLDNALSGIASDIAMHVPIDDCCVYLGGGYGRGEGGVFRISSDEVRLYNDLDFFVFTRGIGYAGRRRIDNQLRCIAEKWGKELGISVDFGPAKELGKLRSVSSRLMFQELKHGHIKLTGAEDAMADLPALLPEELPGDEGLRLLLNRGVGLLLAGEKLLSGDEDSDFILRNIYKCIGGSGDAVLISCGRYAWSGAERVRIFDKFVMDHGWPSCYSEHYTQAYRFKTEPWKDSLSCGHALWHSGLSVWISALDFLLGGVSDISSVREKLHIKAVEHRCRGWFNEVKWVFCLGNLPDFGMLLDPPLYKLVADLYMILSSAESPGYPCGDMRFYRNWKVIN